MNKNQLNKTLSDKLRTTVQDIRRKPYLISDLIPLLNKSADEIDSLREWIKEEGNRTDICTRNILGNICENCQCGKLTTLN